MYWKRYLQGKITIKKILKALFILCIFGLFGITRLWQLEDLPFGLHVDEAGMAYDAWCLSEYGVDRYLKPWPMYLINYGGGQSIMYAYLCIVFIKIFGVGIRVLRMPAVIFSFLNLFFGMKLTKKLYPGNDFMPLAVGALTVVCPYFIMAGRFALDCNLMLGMSTIFLYFFVTAVESGKTGRYVLAGVTGGLILYTYVLSYIILPLFLILAMVYLIRVKRFLVKKWLIMAVTLGILAFPLVLVQIVNMFDLEEFLLGGVFTITKLDFYRSSELGSYRPEMLWSTLTNIFIGDDLSYESVSGYPNLYGISILLAGAGICTGLVRLWRSVKSRKLQTCDFALLWFFSVVFLGAHIDVYVNNINAVFFVVILFAAEGMDIIRNIFGRLSEEPQQERKREVKIRRAKYILTVLLSGIYLFDFWSFSSYYFMGNYSEDTYMQPFFDLTVTEAIEFIEQDPALSQKETQMVQEKIYFGISALADPYRLDVRFEEGELWYENYHLRFLGSVKDDCNYIVKVEELQEFAGRLREAGFAEERFKRYSLFYKK